MKKLRNQSLETGNKEVQFERISAIVCIFDDQAQTYGYVYIYAR